MTRTTVDIDRPILNELKKLGKREGKGLGRLISEILAEALERRTRTKARPSSLHWISKPMQPLVDYTDKDALWGTLDRSER